mgnify:CR=1 FL=1
MRIVESCSSWFEPKPRHLYEDPQLAAPCDLLASNLDNRHLRCRGNSRAQPPTVTIVAATGPQLRGAAT